MKITFDEKGEWGREENPYSLEVFEESDRGKLSIALYESSFIDIEESIARRISEHLGDSSGVEVIVSPLGSPKKLLQSPSMQREIVNLLKNKYSINAVAEFVDTSRR